MFRSRLVQLALAAGAVVVVAAILHTITSKPKPPPPVTATVTRGTVLASVSATGNVNADTQLAVNFLNGGLLTQVLVTEGQRVTRGQPLARIDDRPAREKLAAAQADVANNQAKLGQVLVGPSAPERQQAQSAVGEAQTGVDKAATDVASATQNRDKDVITRQQAVDQARLSLANA